MAQVVQWLAQHLDGIYKVAVILTFVVIVWYTKETYQLRKEMVRQNRLSLRPIVVPVFTSLGSLTINISNVGAGCALNVRVSAVRIAEDVNFPEREIRFNRVSCLNAQTNEPLLHSIWESNKPATRGTGVSVFTTISKKQLTIEFEDVEGQKYITTAMLNHDGFGHYFFDLGAIKDA